MLVMKKHSLSARDVWLPAFLEGFGAMTTLTGGIDMDFPKRDKPIIDGYLLDNLNLREDARKAHGRIAKHPD